MKFRVSGSKTEISTITSVCRYVGIENNKPKVSSGQKQKTQVTQLTTNTPTGPLQHSLIILCRVH